MLVALEPLSGHWPSLRRQLPSPVVSAFRPLFAAATSHSSTSDSSKPKTRTCQAGKHKTAVTNSNIFVGDKGKPGVVACEQPPRSSYSPETIAKATAAALAVLG